MELQESYGNYENIQGDKISYLFLIIIVLIFCHKDILLLVHIFLIINIIIYNKYLPLLSLHTRTIY